jgi:2,4-dienoyl-CoA reductase-like NADH-dependent reductase (Old Yellow Enzyme family)
MNHLFEPLEICGVKLRNRIGVSPMCMYSAADGLANDWHLTHLGSRAVGGAGLILAEATAVQARGRITPYDLGLWNDAQVEPLARITAFLKSHGAVPGIQLAHAGRKASTNRPWDGGGLVEDARGWQVVGASPIAFTEGSPVPHKLSQTDIVEVVEAFASAARRALAAGFEWVEIHGAHGYLIHSFYSPISNQRADAYGGSFTGRTRLALEVAQAVRAAWPANLPLAMRLSCTDWTPGGWTVEDSVALARLLKQEGVDLIDCSSGGNVPRADVPLGPGYQVPLSEAVRQGAGILTAAVGLINAAAHADEIIRNGRADMVLLGRAMLRDPYWALHAAKELGQKPDVPDQYLRAF